MVRIGPQNESHTAGGQSLRQVRKAVQHEAVVPQVRARVEGNGRKENYDGLLQFVGDVNGHIQSRIIWARWARCIQ